MIKAVLFDFDGTLINSNELIFESYRTAFREVLSKELTEDEILEMYGRPLRESLAKYGEYSEQLRSVYREYNDVRHDASVKGFEGASEGVLMLKKLGLKLGIVTSKRLHMLERGVEIMGLSGAFDVYITPDDTKNVKPHPEPVLCGCERLGVAPEEAVYVGDSVFDMEAGRAAGTAICAMKYSLTPAERLLEFDPEFFADSILQFANELKVKNNGCNS